MTAFRGELFRQPAARTVSAPPCQPPEFPAHGWPPPEVSSPDVDLLARVLDGLRQL
ncbi:hypothetical protein [Actinopolyspora erythraea]|uniref:hypothetical protein n=1 Tax=Actinopolyspora erythraea TaxID=414996 RepID=UPI000A49698B|nr:hypothetical protein [Actinopolyspora erythraea]